MEEHLEYLKLKLFNMKLNVEHIYTVVPPFLHFFSNRYGRNLFKGKRRFYTTATNVIVKANFLLVDVDYLLETISNIDDSFLQRFIENVESWRQLYKDFMQHYGKLVDNVMPFFEIYRQEMRDLEQRRRRRAQTRNRRPT